MIKEKMNDEKLHFISCETGQGIENLIKEIDLQVLSRNGSKIRRLKLRHDSPSLPYLYKNNFISSTNLPTSTDDGKYLIVNVLMNDDQFSKFVSNIPNKISKKKVTASAKST
uniref:Uncharacterized protein n=1 Tax=Panagrolaimus sp. JU765 TaxID=591449 RepID=A0AC34RN08_9BILA